MSEVVDTAGLTIDVGDSTCLLMFTDDGLDVNDLGSYSATPVSGVIKIRSTVRGQELVDVVLHEALHAMVPMASEKWITQVSTQLAALVFHPEVLRRGGLG